VSDKYRIVPPVQFQLLRSDYANNKCVMQSDVTTSCILFILQKSSYISQPYSTLLLACVG